MFFLCFHWVQKETTGVKLVKARCSFLFYCYFSAIVGEIDDEIDSGLEMQSIKAEPFNPVVY